MISMVSRDYIERLEERICKLESQNRTYYKCNGDGPFKEAGLRDMIRAIAKYLNIEFKYISGVTAVKKDAFRNKKRSKY